MKKRYLIVLIVLLVFVTFAFAQETKKEEIGKKADTETGIKSEVGTEVETKVETEKGASPEGMVFIPGGTFEMGIAEKDLEALVEMGKKVPHMSMTHAKWWFGDEVPKHAVGVAPFYMDIHEVTNRKFKQFVEETGYDAQGEWEKYAEDKRMDHPVVNVTWNDAKAYADWAGKRLPTEAEWEYAAKGGKDVNWFPWGDEPDGTKANYRYKGESFFAGVVRLIGLRKMGTKPVGSYEPNGFGIYDMVGNVSEWLADTHEPYPDAPITDWPYIKQGPFAKEDAKPVYGKVQRGGNWDSPNPVYVRITGRTGFNPKTYSNGLGFRCAKSIPVKEEAEPETEKLGQEEK